MPKIKKLNLGCPRYCKGWVCVDRYPDKKDKSKVIKSDVLDFLNQNKVRYDLIYSKNLLEHLTDIGGFLKSCHETLTEKGRLEIITDNALFFPYYIPLPKRLNAIRKDGLGFACHTMAYPRNTPHYSIFTKSHLYNLYRKYEFEIQDFKYGIFPTRWIKKGFGKILSRCFLMPKMKIIGVKDKIKETKRE